MKTARPCTLYHVFICSHVSARGCLISASTCVAANFVVSDQLEVEQEAGVAGPPRSTGAVLGPAPPSSGSPMGHCISTLPSNNEVLERTSILGQCNFVWRHFNELPAQILNFTWRGNKVFAHFSVVSFVVYKLLCSVPRLVAGSSACELRAGTFLSNDKFISSQRRAKGYVKPG